MGKFSIRKSDIEGVTIGRLIPLFWSGRDKWGKSMWVCRCSCGTVREYLRSNLLNSKTLSCGCYRKPRKHGETCGKTQTPEYKCWAHMKQRCTNKNNAKYKDYGGRGISICSRWLKSFDNFLKDMGRKPSSEYSIDRINVNDDYKPSNCRWATPKQQANNKRFHVNIK